MTFTTCTELYKHLHYLIPERFLQPYKKAVTPNFSLPPSLATTDLFPVFMDLPLLDLHINGIIQYVAFGVWLLSPGTFLGFFYIKACISPSLFYMAEYPILWREHILFIYTSVNENLGGFHLLAIMQLINAIMNVHIRGSML